MSKNNINIQVYNIICLQKIYNEFMFDYVEKGKKHNLHQNISHNSADITFLFKRKRYSFCYYIIVNGIQNYEMLFNNTYKEEKKK